MSDYLDNSISVDDILAEYHSLEQLASRPGAEQPREPSRDFSPEPVREAEGREPAETVSRELPTEDRPGLGRMDFSMGQVQADVAVAPENDRSRRLPSEEEIRAYTAAALGSKEYLNIAKDIDNSSTADPVEMDKRFRVDGRMGPSTFVYDGEEVDTSDQEDYIPPVQEVHLEDSSENGPFSGVFKGVNGRRRKTSVRKRKFSGRGFDDSAVPPPEDENEGFREYTSYSIPLAESSYPEDYDNDGEERSFDDDGGLIPKGFKGYIVSVIATVLYKLRWNKHSEYNGDEVESEEELGRELSPKEGSKYYSSFIRTLRLRIQLGAILWLIIFWISSGLPVPGGLKSVLAASCFCTAIQFTIMLLCLDVVTNAVMNIRLGKLGADFLAVFACLITSIDGFMVTKAAVSPHLPLCVLSSLSLLGVGAASLVNVRSLRKALRVPAIAKSVYSVTSEKAVGGMGHTLLKSSRPIRGFVRRAEEAPVDEDMYIKFTPVLLILSLVLSCVLSAIKGAFSDFVYIFSALASATIPFAALLSFALPYFVGTMRIFRSGAAIAGWSGVCDIGESKDLIITDIDIFPRGTVEIESVRIFADTDADKIISYAGSMVAPSGMATSSCFIDLMRSTNAKKMRIDNIEFLPAGGIKGIIQGERVLCGNLDLMRLMNVRVPSKLVDKNSVLLAVDGVLYGIFNIKYTPLQRVRTALTELMKSNRQSVFAIRDFNVTPEMLREAFDVATDGYTFPPYLERFRISSAKSSRESKISGVVCRESLGPLIDLADAGRSMYVSSKVNTGISLGGSFVGTLFVFLKLLIGGSIGVMQLFAVMTLFSLPVPLISFFAVKRRQ